MLTNNLIVVINFESFVSFRRMFTNLNLCLILLRLQISHYLKFSLILAFISGSCLQ